MFSILRNNFAIFLFVLSAVSCSSLSSNLTREEDLLFAVLLSCLTSTGANFRDIHHRNSGIVYDELNWQWNTLNGYIEPLAYFIPTDVSDVQKAVFCCKLSKVRIVARSGGHSYVKNGFGNSRSLIVDLKELNQISLAPQKMECEIGAGARLGQVAYSLWKNGNFFIPSGDCPTVGIGGLTLGGGYGRFTTLLGLTSDNVIEMEMVDAKGRLLVINNSTNSDLFWALRGGGGGNFGIVTKFKFKMYSVPTSIVYGYYEYNFKDFSRFYDAWQLLITSGMPTHISSYLEMRTDRFLMEVIAINLPHRNVTIETATSIANFVNLFSFPIPTNSSIQIQSYATFMLSDARRHCPIPQTLTHMSQLEKLHRVPVIWKKVKSFFVDKILNASQISQLKQQLSDYLQHTEFHSEPNGGAINQFSYSDTAFVHRGKNLFHFQLKAFTTQNESSDLRGERVHAMNLFYEQSKSVFNHQESYQNYLDEDMVDLKRYYGRNFKRLVQIKGRIDPENVFHHPQSIPVKCD